jgi:hypothetical protein
MPPTLLSPFYAAHSLTPAVTSFLASLPTSFAPAELKQWYLTPATNPLHPALLFAAGISVLVWVLGEITGE